MRLASFRHAGRTRLCIVVSDGVVDLAVADPALPRTLPALLAMGPKGLARARTACEGAAARRPLDPLALEPPVRPSKCLAIGLNYVDHVRETGRHAPEFPLFFNKQVSCIHPPFAPVHLPRVSDELDYEGELAIVIGRRARHVAPEQAPEVIGGYTILNDLSVRDWQRRAPTMTLGKSFDTHGPLGPWLVTPDEIGDPHDLRLRTWINGELRQDASTRAMIFNCFEQVATLSTVMTLEPGDVISTGTPAGVGMAFEPPRFLRPGDRVRVEIERIGHIENEVIPEPCNP
ncbi:MAG: fumarylacetoacetate hydrolase family protein [Myxococcota bacterium]